MPRTASLVAPLVALLASGCIFSHLSPQRRLMDQAHAYNDEVRWARIDLAAQRVHSEYRGTFLVSHGRWGSDIQIADADMTNMTFEEEGEGATTLVRYAWFDQRTMIVQATVVSQHWRSEGDESFVLDRETVVQGDEGLLELPEPTQGEEQETTAAFSAGGERLATR